jgi:TonB family protein
VLTAVAVAYVCGLLYFAGRLGWGVWTTEAMRRRAMPFEPAGETATKTARFQRMLGRGTSDSEVHFASSTDISGPATVGLRRKTLLLPPAFLDKLSAEDLDAVLAHELAHIERWDFAKNLLYGVLTLPVAYHPLLSLTRKRLAETRELVCDVMAAEAVGGRESYARSLLRLARMLSDRPAPRVLHAIGIFDANIFERRVMQLSRRSLEIKGGRRFAIAAACVVVALVTCTSALALRMDVNSPSAQSPKSLNVDAKDAAANILSKVAPVYPPDAKKARVTGSVVLEAMIGKDGNVENLKVVSGPSMLQQSAMDAVRQWTYKPYLLNGDPVEIKTKITVVYSLSK